MDRASRSVSFGARRGNQSRGFAALAAAALLLALQPAFAATPTPEPGRVRHVVDGDTLDVLLGERRVRVRLAEIDAPEARQLFGHRSRQSLIQTCGGELAQIERRGTDRNNRVIARVTFNGTDAGEEQVRRGMAWVFDRYAEPGSPLYAVQAEARAARRGLCAEAQPVGAVGVARVKAPQVAHDARILVRSIHEESVDPWTRVRRHDDAVADGHV